MKSSSSDSAVQGYKVLPASDAQAEMLLTKVLSPRRGPIPSLPNITQVECSIIGDSMFDRFDMADYQGCITAEMRKRPVPQVFLESEVKPLTDLYTKWAPHIVAWYLPQIVPPYQAYNKVSRVGWPGFHRPENKLHYVTQFMPEVLAGDLSRFEEAFIAFNVRLQAETKTKVREFQFVSPDGTVYAQKIAEADRVVDTASGRRVGSRTRLVFNLPVYNLVKQILDSAIHNVFMKHPAFHHDMANGNILPVRGYHVALDIKHFERHTAACNRVRAQLLGGVYAKCSEVTSRIPFAVHADNWKSCFFLYPDRANGYSDQYASGDSAVAPSQKEIMMAVYASFFQQELGYGVEQAIHQVAQGGEARLTIRNYGDDNSIDGDEGCVRDFIAYASQFLHVEEENPPKFLGFVWYPELHSWKLPVTSYLLKNYLNERAPFSAFRKYPNFGWMEKRKVFEKQGHPDVSAKVIPQEDIEIENVGCPWFRVAELAKVERRQALFDKVDFSNPLLAMEKDWAMTAEEKMKTGLATGLPPASTARMLPSLLGSSQAAKLTYR